MLIKLYCLAVALLVAGDALPLTAADNNNGESLESVLKRFGFFDVPKPTKRNGPLDVLPKDVTLKEDILHLRKNHVDINNVGTYRFADGNAVVVGPQAKLLILLKESSSTTRKISIESIILNDRGWTIASNCSASTVSQSVEDILNTLSS